MGAELAAARLGVSAASDSGDRGSDAIAGLSFVAAVAMLSQVVIPALVPSLGWALALLTAVVVPLSVFLSWAYRRIERSDRLT